MKFSPLLKTSLLGLFLALTQLAQAQDEELAREYQRKGEFDKAASLFETVYKQNYSQAVYDDYLTCLIELQDWKSAEKLTKKQIKRFKNYPIYHIDLGMVLSKSGNKEGEIAAYEEALSFLPDQLNMIHPLANRFIKYQELDWALKVYKTGQALLPSSSFQLQMAEIYAQQEKTEEFLEQYLDLIQINRAYIQTVKSRLSRVISDDPNFETNQILRRLLITRIQDDSRESYIDLLTWLFIQEKNFNQAFIQLRALDKRMNDDQQRIFQLARIAFNNKAYEAAINSYDYIIEVGQRSPYYLDARMSRLRVLQEKVVTTTDYTLEDLNKLETAYLETLDEFGKGRQTILLIRDLAHLRAFYLGQEDSAQTLLEAALEIPGATDLHRAELKMELADVYLFRGMVWDAILLYGQVEKAFKEDRIGQEAKFRRARVYYFTGDFGFAQGQLDVLKASTSKLIANNAMELALLINDNTALDTSTEALSIYARADLKVYQKQYNQALGHLDSLIKIHIANSIIDEAYFLKAQALAELERYPEAVQLLETVTKQYGSDLLGDDALFLLGQIYQEQIGDSEKAMEAFRQLLERYPGSIFTVEARSRFRTLRGDLKP